MIGTLNDRTREILKLVIDAYVETGEPVGSRAISQKPGMRLSPATIRAAMAELEDLGLLYAPHTSAGRLPTDSGLTVFVDGLMELDTLSPQEQRRIDDKISALRNPAQDPAMTGVMEETSRFLSGLASCAGLVFAPKADTPVRQVEFVLLNPGRVLAVIVSGAGQVENRLLEVSAGVTASTLSRAANYLNARIADKTLQQAADHIRAELQRDKSLLDALTARVVEAGVASLAPADSGGHLFVKGQANLLDDVTAIEDVERIRNLIDALDAKEEMLKILQSTTQADGVRIFIGAENKLFGHSGCAMVVSPYKSSDARVVGAIGVIGPARMNYRRVIPVINYTSQLVGRLMDPA